MAAIRGVKLLPSSIPMNESGPLFMKLATVSSEIARLDEKFKRSKLRSDFINTLALNESVQSTRIEGTQVTFTHMIENSHKTKLDKAQIEVNNYQKALEMGSTYIQNGYPISTRIIQDIHKILMEGEARGTVEASGQFRKIQNWIGPSQRIEDAKYIPVPAQDIDLYMSNWESYTNGLPYEQQMDVSHLDVMDYILDEKTHPLLKVAIVHAQFESIHPFLDGNGRLGRIIIALYMMQSEQVSSPIFFVSEELERQRHKYYHFLNETRGENPNWSNWLHFFLDASQRMAKKLNGLLDRAEQLVAEGQEKCQNLNLQKIYLFTFRHPNVTATQVIEHFGISATSARRYLNELADMRLLYRNQDQKRNVEYINYDLLELISR